MERPPVTQDSASRPFRFGVVAAQARSAEEWTARARRIESLGYATLLVPDGLRYTLAPLPALAAAAAVTTSLRVGTYVIANDFRNPVLLAKEAATVDLVSGGRFELGLGVGRPAAAEDNRMLGLAFDSGGVRVARLAESLALIKPLLAGETATASGPHYAAAGAAISPGPVQQPRPPILIAGSGRRLLSLAAREADIVALGVAPAEGEAGVAERIGWLREAAPGAEPQPDGGRRPGAALDIGADGTDRRQARGGGRGQRRGRHDRADARNAAETARGARHHVPRGRRRAHGGLRPGRRAPGRALTERSTVVV